MNQPNSPASAEAKHLDEKGRCCGRKPIHYKGGSWCSPQIPQKFCDRCCRAYDPATGCQIENWAFKLADGVFISTKGDR